MSSISRVTSSTLCVTGSNPQVTTSNQKHEKRKCKCVPAHEVLHSLPLYAAALILDVFPPSPHELRMYLIGGPFFNQKSNKDIRISSRASFVKKTPA